MKSVLNNPRIIGIPRRFNGQLSVSFIGLVSGSFLDSICIVEATVMKEKEGKARNDLCVVATLDARTRMIQWLVPYATVEVELYAVRTYVRACVRVHLHTCLSLPQIALVCRRDMSLPSRSVLSYLQNYFLRKKHQVNVSIYSCQLNLISQHFIFLHTSE